MILKTLADMAHRRYQRRGLRVHSGQFRIASISLHRGAEMMVLSIDFFSKYPMVTYGISEQEGHNLLSVYVLAEEGSLNLDDRTQDATVIELKIPTGDWFVTESIGSGAMYLTLFDRSVLKQAPQLFHGDLD